MPKERWPGGRRAARSVGAVAAAAVCAVRNVSVGLEELHVIRGDVDAKSDFANVGKLVFELFYRCDLDTFG